MANIQPYKPQQQMSYDEIERLAKAMVQSQYFQDVKDVAQAIVKIKAGQEFGFGAFASMNGISIIKGRPALGANLISSAIKSSGRYDYKIIELTDKNCNIEFYENGQKVGNSVFSIDDARKAGTANLDKFPRNMLFARAISNGMRWYCPDVLYGSVVYTPEELGAVVDENGEVISMPIDDVIEPPGERLKLSEPEKSDAVWDDEEPDVEEEEEPQTLISPYKPRKGNPSEPLDLLEFIVKKSKTLAPATDKQIKLVGRLLAENVVSDIPGTLERVKYFFTNQNHLHDADPTVVTAMLKWINPNPFKQYAIDPISKAELDAVIDWVNEDQLSIEAI